MAEVFVSGNNYVPEQVDQIQYVWLTDGSSFYKMGVQKTGFAALQVDIKNHSAIKVINGYCKFTSAQVVELVGIIMAIKNTSVNASVGLFSYSNWVVWALSHWLPVWQSQGYHTSDGKAVKYAYCHTTGTNRSLPVQLGKVRAYQKEGIVARLNHQADAYDKEGVLMDHE